VGCGIQSEKRKISEFLTVSITLPVLHTYIYSATIDAMGLGGGQLVEALRYKPEGRGFDCRWNHWDFSFT
jgi:hypothetical protein